MPRSLPALATAAFLLLMAATSFAQEISGELFADRNSNGVRDASEPLVTGASVTVHGPSGDVTPDASTGAFVVATNPGCNAVRVMLPWEPDPASPLTSPAWRPSVPDQTTCPATGSDPEGIRRYGVPRYLLGNLAAGGFHYISMGDSIAAGVSVCVFADSDYVEDVVLDIECLGDTITVDNRAVGGAHVEDFLTVRDGGAANRQFIPNVVAAAPDLVTISIGGNDFLNTEPGTAATQTYPYQPADLQRSFSELVRTRQSLQEALSVLVSELPGADIEINTVYDNQAGDCSTTDFHAAAPPVWNQMLRMTAFGQIRPLVVAEVDPEFAHQDVLRSSCCGASGRICTFDNIHPNHDGSLIIQEAVDESLGRVIVPAAASEPFRVGFQQLVARLEPSVAETMGGTVTSADRALELDGFGAGVMAGGWLELSGFSVPPDIQPHHIVVGVRTKTSTAFIDDTYRAEASYDNFAPPQWTFTGWDTQTPLIGGSGQAGNIGNPSVVNLLASVPNWRDVSSTVTLNAIDDGRVTGAFSWPLPTGADIANLRVRFTVDVVGTPDTAILEVDGTWAWVYGETSSSAPLLGEVSPPGSATPLLVSKAPGGIRIDYGREPSATDYRIYRGTIGAWSGAIADPTRAGGCSTTLTFLDPLRADATGDWYYLVSAVKAASEGPLGTTSLGVPRRVAGATCP